MAGFFAQPRALRFFALGEKHHPTYECHRTHDGRHWHRMVLIARGVDRPNIDDLLSRRISETTPSQTCQTQHDQHDS